MSDVTAVPLRPVGKGGLAALWVGIIVLLILGIGGAWAASKKATMAAMPAADFMIANGKRRGVNVTNSGLQYQVLKKGTAPGVTPGLHDIALVDYRGTLTNGVQFDASKPGEPAALPVGQVVPGFAEALMLMPKGAKYRVWIPPQLAYGERAAGPIPADSVLVFDITMRDFAPMPQQQMPVEGLSQQDGMPQDQAPQGAPAQDAPHP